MKLSKRNKPEPDKFRLRVRRGLYGWEWEVQEKAPTVTGRIDYVQALNPMIRDLRGSTHSHDEAKSKGLMALREAIRVDKWSSEAEYYYAEDDRGG
jgi:hypothetical protein